MQLLTAQACSFASARHTQARPTSSEGGSHGRPSKLMTVAKTLDVRSCLQGTCSYILSQHQPLHFVLCQASWYESMPGTCYRISTAVHHPCSMPLGLGMAAHSIAHNSRIQSELWLDACSLKAFAIPCTPLTALSSLAVLFSPVSMHAGRQPAGMQPNPSLPQPRAAPPSQAAVTPQRHVQTDASSAPRVAAHSSDVAGTQSSRVSTAASPGSTSRIAQEGPRSTDQASSGQAAASSPVPSGAGTLASPLQVPSSPFVL